MKGKISVVLVTTLLFILSFTVFVSAQTDSTIWHDDMSYSSVAQMQAAGWASEHIDGVSIGSGGVIIDGSSSDTAIHFSSLSSGVYNWKVESRGRWVSGSHSGPDVAASTEKHSYTFQADGWYSQFAFYHDGNKVWASQQGTYSESKNTYETVTLVKNNNQVNCYFNGQLEYTYTEDDTSAAQLVGVSAVCQWDGATEYNYFAVSTDTSSPSGTTQSDNILSNPVVIGGAVVGVGVGVSAAVYYFVIAGGNSAASAGSGAGSAGAGAGGGDGSGSGSGGDSSGGSGNTGGGTLIHNHPPQSAGELAMGDISNMSDVSAQLQTMQNQQNNAQTIQTQMQADNQQNQADRWKIQQDLQPQNFQNPQDVTVNKTKTQDKAFQGMDQYIRSQNDPDAVADSGEGGGGGGEA
jgi:hypothetical protein